MRLVISQRNRVHRLGCAHACTTELWQWANTVDRMAVAEAVFEQGLSICQICRPFSIERDRREEQRR